MNKIIHHPYAMSRRQKGLRHSNTGFFNLPDDSFQIDFIPKLPCVSHKMYFESTQQKKMSAIENLKCILKGVYGDYIRPQRCVLNEKMECDPPKLVETDKVVPMEVVTEEIKMDIDMILDLFNLTLSEENYVMSTNIVESLKKPIIQPARLILPQVHFKWTKSVEDLYNC